MEKLIEQSRVNKLFVTGITALRFHRAISNYCNDELVQKLLSKAEENNVEIEIADDFLTGDVNDPYCHTHVIEVQDMMEEEEIGIIDLGPRSSQRLMEILNDFQRIILYGETGNSWCRSGRDCTKDLFYDVKESDRSMVCVGGEVENFAKNVVEVAEEGRWEELNIVFVGEDFLKRYSHMPSLENLGFLLTPDSHSFETQSDKVKVESKSDNKKTSPNEKGDQEDKKVEVKKEQRRVAFDIFVGGLPSDTTKEALLEYFGQFGEIAKCAPQFWGKKSSKNWKCKGFGIISCKNEQTYSKILEQKLHKFRDRKIECKPKLKKTKLAKYSKNLLKRKIFISGLPSYVTSEKLETILSENIGEVEIAYVIKHRKSKKSRGFGFVVFKNQSDREKLLEMGSFQVKDRMIKCSAYEPKAKADDQSQKAEIERNPLTENQGKDSVKPTSSKTDSLCEQEFNTSFAPINKDEAGKLDSTKKHPSPNPVYNNLFLKLKKKKTVRKNHHLTTPESACHLKANRNDVPSRLNDFDQKEALPPKYKESSKQLGTRLNGYSYFGGYKI